MALKNVCNCPRPPGGQAVCDSDQLAICRVLSGQIYTECHSMPRNISSNEAASNWVLGKVTNMQRSAQQQLNPDDLYILNTGHFINPANGDEATFEIPNRIKLGYFPKF